MVEAGRTSVVVVACLTFSALSPLGCAGKAVMTGPSDTLGSAGAPAAADSGEASSAGGALSNTAGAGSAKPHGAAGSAATGSGGTGSAKPSVGGAGSTSASAGVAGAGGYGSIAGAGAAAEPEGVPLTPTNGWIDGQSNALMIQGGVFAFADPTSTLSLTGDFMGTKACISGTAARVDISCTPVAPAADCYGVTFGSAIGLNLNQPLDVSTDPPTALLPLAFDASALKGFSFEIQGNNVPPPSSLRFEVDSADSAFCTSPAQKIKVGVNRVLLSELFYQCYLNNSSNPTAVSAQSALIKLAWHVVTNTNGTVPYDFCVSNIRALRK